MTNVIDLHAYRVARQARREWSPLMEWLGRGSVQPMRNDWPMLPADCEDGQA